VALFAWTMLVVTSLPFFRRFMVGRYKLNAVYPALDTA
jgi:hypothetical protein